MHKFFGKWITSEEFCDLCPQDVYGKTAAGASELCDAHILFGKTFRYDGKAAVTLYYSADDYCKVYINGAFVSCGPAPSYPFRMRYVRENITRYLHQGENRIAVHSYYQGLVNRVWVSSPRAQSPSPPNGCRNRR